MHQAVQFEEIAMLFDFSFIENMAIHKGTHCYLIYSGIFIVIEGQQIGDKF